MPSTSFRPAGLRRATVVDELDPSEQLLPETNTGQTAVFMTVATNEYYGPPGHPGLVLRKNGVNKGVVVSGGAQYGYMVGQEWFSDPYDSVFHPLPEATVINARADALNHLTQLARTLGFDM